MPNMDGVQFLAQVKAKLPDSVRMMLTAFPDMETAIEAVNQGNVFRFLTKPVTPQILTAALGGGLGAGPGWSRTGTGCWRCNWDHTQKMELVGQCTAGLAHDMRNILSIIQICAHRALEQQASPAELSQSLQRIHEAAAHATNLTQQLVTFGSRRQPRSHFEPVDLKKLLEDLSALLRPVLTRRIALQCKPSPGLEPVWGDATMLGQVVMNLAINARDAMPNGGQLTIQAESRVITVHTVSQHPGARLGRFLCLSVTETAVQELTPSCGRGCLSRSSPPRRTARAPAWVCRLWRTSSNNITAGAEVRGLPGPGNHL